MSNLKEDISYANAVIAMLDAMENFRPLTSLEFELRENITLHLDNLLKQQKAYQQQRGKIKWATLGVKTLNSFMPWPLCSIETIAPPL